MGRLSNQAAVQRSKDFHDVIGMDMCNFITLIDEQTANWSRDEAQDMMTNWIATIHLTLVSLTRDSRLFARAFGTRRTSVQVQQQTLRRCTALVRAWALGNDDGHQYY